MRLFLNINDYKQIIAQQNSGGYSKGDIISSPLQLDNIGNGTLGAARKMIDGGAQTLAQTTYSISTSVYPIRPYSVEINVPGIGYGKDDGQGNVLGFGFSGTVDYTSGDIELDVGGSAGTGSTVTDKIQILLDLDVDAADDLETIQAGLVTKDIRAQIWALASDVGAFANFAFAQRFGRSAIDEVAADLTSEITRILNTNAVAALVSNVPTVVGGYTKWYAKETDVSYAETKLTFIDALAQAEAVLFSQSGATMANRLIAGKNASATLRGMPNFELASDVATVSVGLFGYYDGVPVIRASGVANLGDDDIILVSNAGNYFSAPLAYAPLTNDCYEKLAA